MKEETGVVLKNMLRNFLLKGVLVSVIVFFIAMFINSAVVLAWFSTNDVSITSTQWTIIGILGGLYPMAVYIVLGVFRCLRVLYADVFTAFIKPQIRVITDFSTSKLDDKVKASEILKKEFSTSLIFSVVEYVDSRLSKFPKLIRVSIHWVLIKISIEKEFLSYIETIENLTPEGMSQKLSEWLEEKLQDVVGDLKPFWMKLLIPIHVGLLIGLWFIHLIDV
jgi:hypothetical protein